MLYYFSYPISVLMLLWIFLIKTLMVDESPPLFTMNEMRNFYISSALMFLFYLFTLKSGSKSLIKLIIALIPVLLMLIFQGIIIFKKIYLTNFAMTIFLMDLIYEIELIIIFVCGLYSIKKIFSKKVA